VSQETGDQEWHRQRDTQRSADGPGYLSGVQDHGDALSTKQESRIGLGIEEDNMRK